MDLMIIELIYGPTIMPFVDTLYVYLMLVRMGAMRSIFEYMYEYSRWWRRFCYYYRKYRKAVMTNCKRIKFYNFENAWEISNKTRYKNAKLNIKSSFRYRRTKKFPKIVNCRLSRKRKMSILSALPTITVSSETKLKGDRKKIINFDTDSYSIGIDNRTSYSMSPSMNDFITPIEPAKDLFIRGIGGLVKVQGKGTVKWNITDDDGFNHDIIIPGTLYVKGIQNRLLSPQHWSQTANDNFPKKRGTRSITYDDELILEWNQRKHSKSVPLDKITNTFTIHSSPGTSKFLSHVTEIERTEQVWYSEQCILCNDAELNNSANISTFSHDGFVEENSDELQSNIPARQEIKLYDEAYENLPAKDLNREFIRWHYRLGHMSFKKMKLLAVLGVLPSRLQECSPPTCATCIYGGMTKRPWRSKPSKLSKGKLIQITKPGQCISVDQMEVREEGLIAQLKGKLTRQRYKYATIFVDQYSDLSYVHLQRHLTSDETVQAKLAFEAYARSMGVSIRHYHADNGRFADNLFIQSIESNGQTISFCGVGAHHQNGRAEKRIRDLRESARKMILHANSR